jgi:hypothetical protein
MTIEREIHSSSLFFSLLAKDEERGREEDGLESRVGIAEFKFKF